MCRWRLSQLALSTGRHARWRSLAPVLLLALTGCTEYVIPEPAGDDPGNPQAVSSPLPPLSDTLLSEPVETREVPAMDHSQHRMKQ